MTEKEAVIQLNFDMEMIRFDPSTGENLTLEQIKAQNEDNYKTYLADELAITALLEIQQYRAIGTVKEIKIREAQFARLSEGYLHDLTLLREYQSIGTIEELQALKEKSVAKKPIRNDLCTCPSCGTYNEIIEKRRKTVAFDTVNCWHCGQAIEIKRD